LFETFLSPRVFVDMGGKSVPGHINICNALQHKIHICIKHHEKKVVTDVQNQWLVGWFLLLPLGA
jgi:hypothetical protein